MKLKQIQLQGFKSFVNRTVLNFTDDITLVVGPNGCGKSNVVDAIRWAMGEMSAKHLRGESMEDVISNGSDEVASTGMAEVTLVFDNSDGLAFGELSRFSEIQVTRRLFRSGDSEYYINRTPCRLKDITDIFLGSGAGTRAYSMVEQGRIEEIVTMKAEQRRILIEEAAGVSKYRVRKQEAERKILSTRDNLTRLRDIIAELKRQMNSLNRQAKKAERFKEYRDELKTIELELAAFRGHGLRAEDESSRARKSGLDDQELGLTTGLETSEALLESKKAGLTDLERALSASQFQALEAERAVEKEETALAMIAQERKNLLASRERLQAEAEELTAQAAARDQALAEALAAVREIEADLAKAREEHKAAEEGRAWKDKDCQESSRAAAELEKDFAGLKKDLDKLRERVEWTGWKKLELSEKLGRLSERAQKLELSEEDQARANLSLNEKIYQLRKNLTELREIMVAREQELKDLQTQREVAADRRQVLSQNYERVSTRRDSLLEMEKNFEGYQRGVKSVMARKAMLEAQGQNGTYGLLTDLIKVDREYEMALEAVLGERLQSIVVKTRRHGLENIQYLREESGGRSSFVPLESSGAETAGVPESLRSLGAEPLASHVQVNPDYAPVVKTLIGSTLLVPDLEEAALVRERWGLKTALVTREGVVLDERGVLVGGSPDSFSGFLAKKREIGELATLLTEIEADKEKTGVELMRLVEQIREAEREVAELRERHHRSDIEKNNLEKDLRQGVEAFNQMKQERSALLEESQKTAEAITGLEQEAETAAALIALKETDRSQAELLLRERQEQLQAQLAERAAEVERCHGAELRVAGLSEKLQSHQRDQSRLQRERDELRAGTHKREREQGELNLHEQELAAQVEEIQGERGKAAAVAKERKDRVEAKRLHYEQEASALREGEAAIKALYREREQVKDERQKTELKLTELKMAWDGLAENTRDKYSRELADLCQEYRGRLADYPEAERRAQREELREKIARVGDVNLTALEEFEEISRRYSFLTNQEADLIAALENLELTIGKINTEYRKAFKQTFEEVNAKFKQVFPRLFNGGQASLALSDPDETLDSGVEILAQPPGKKMHHISSLSGGEKALTATSLIIALFQVKPSPFCLLDEVDAALDDVNVVRFNEIIQELARDSQLIVITHNRKTMEIADAIYGVTMEQKGISKIVSVRFKEERSAEPAGEPAAHATSANP